MPKPIIVPFNLVANIVASLLVLLILLFPILFGRNVSNGESFLFIAVAGVFAGAIIIQTFNLLVIYHKNPLLIINEQGITYVPICTIAWQDIEKIKVSYQFPYLHSLTIKLKHSEPYWANIPPHERKAFLRQSEFNIPATWLPLPAKTLLQQIEQEYGSYYQLASLIQAA